MRLFTFWRDLDDDDKERVIKITGLLIAVFAIFTLLANVSYLFTWKTDQSLLSTEISDKSIEVSNICGKLGFKWSYFLVTQCFGLGSFALILILFAVSMRLLLKRWHYSMLRTILRLRGAMRGFFRKLDDEPAGKYRDRSHSGCGGNPLVAFRKLQVQALDGWHWQRQSGRRKRA